MRLNFGENDGLNARDFVNNSKTSRNQINSYKNFNITMQKSNFNSQKKFGNSKRILFT